MTQILVPSRGPTDWQALLAEPAKQWARGGSAKALAHCWEAARGFPAEVKAALDGCAALGGADALLILPEWQVTLPGGVRPSQNDIWVLARGRSGLISIAVEGKVDEPFGPTLGEWKADASTGKQTRLAFLQQVLGLTAPLADTVRYQLLHRTASAVLEAQRFGAGQAVVLIHSFSPENRWLADFAAFTALFGVDFQPGHLASATARDGMPLHLGWVCGDRKFLEV